MKQFLFIGLILIAAALLGCPRPPTDDKNQSSNYISADPSLGAKDSSRPITIIANDLKWLTTNSPLVFLGTLENKTSGRDRNGLIFSKNDFVIKQLIKGNYQNRNISINTLGGEYEGTIMNVSHMPKFSKEYEYVIFMDPQKTTYSPITGNEAGVLIVQMDGIYTYGGQSIKLVQDNKIITGNKLLLRRDTTNALGVKTVTETPKSSSADVQIETIDANRLAEKEEILKLSELIRLIQSFK